MVEVWVVVVVAVAARHLHAARLLEWAVLVGVAGEELDERQRRLAHDGEGLLEQIVLRLSSREAAPELLRLCLERLVAQLLDLILQRVDAVHPLRVALHPRCVLLLVPEAAT